MYTNNSKKKAIIWLVVLLVFAIIFTLINQIIQVLEFQGGNVYPEAPQLVRVGIFLLACVIFYFFPLLRTHYHARKAEIKWLTILSKVLLIHFYCVLGITAILVIVSIFQLL